MTVVTLTDYRPIPRVDAEPFTQIRVEEAVSEDGTYTLIDTQTIPDPDPDPAEPRERSFTTELATLTEGWYRLTFLTDDGDELPTEPVFHRQILAQPFAPSLTDVGARLRIRTRNTDGREVGTFTESTRPTGNQVQRIIDAALDDVTDTTGTDIPDVLETKTRSVIALRAAIEVELSFFGDQIGNRVSPYTELKKLYDEQLPKLLEAIQEDRLGEDYSDADDLGLPVGVFPPPSWIGSRSF